MSPVLKTPGRGAGIVPGTIGLVLACAAPASAAGKDAVWPIAGAHVDPRMRP